MTLLKLQRVDLSKRSFHAPAWDGLETEIWKAGFNRKKLPEFIAQLLPYTIAMQG